MIPVSRILTLIPGWMGNGEYAGDDNAGTGCTSMLESYLQPAEGQVFAYFGSFQGIYTGFSQEVATQRDGSYHISYEFAYSGSMDGELYDTLETCDVRVRLTSLDGSIVYYDASSSAAQKLASFVNSDNWVRITSPSFSCVPGPSAIVIDGFSANGPFTLDDIAVYPANSPQPSIYNRRKARKAKF